MVATNSDERRRATFPADLPPRAPVVIDTVVPGHEWIVRVPARRRKIAYSPGCGSATEIADAQELGCEIVKVFPGGSVGGPEFVKSILGPCPWTKIMPTGGVDCTEDSLTKWFKAGVACVGIGSNLITKELLEAKDYAGVANKVRDTIALIRKIRGK